MREYIDRDAFLADKKWLYCTDCDKRKGKKRGKTVTLYEIGEAPCKSCGIHDMLEEVEEYPAADVCPYYIGNKHDRGDDSLCRKWVCEVKAVRPVEWKSVREHTPEPGRYLTCRKTSTIPHSYYQSILSYTDNLESVDEYDFEGENVPGWFEYDSEYGYYSCDNVEWFMPLPEPPKEE